MSSQSSSTDYVALLNLAQQYLYRFGGPLLICLGTVSCVISLIVFSKKNLRKNPCSVYMMAFYIASFLAIYTSLLFIILATGYNINLNSYNVSFCRFVVYSGTLWNKLASFYLMLASVDRIFITSSNATTRQRSTRPLAYTSVISITIFWSLADSHILVFSDIVQIAPNYFTCYFSSGAYLTFQAYYYVVVNATLIPLTLSILGLWAFKNLQRTRRVRVVPVLPEITPRGTGGLRSLHSKDVQLIRMLLIDISVYIICKLMFSIVLMYQQITQYNTKSLIQSRIEVFVRYVATMIAYIPYCVSCYTNLLGLKPFRNEVKGIFGYK